MTIKYFLFFLISPFFFPFYKWLEYMVGFKKKILLHFFFTFDRCGIKSIIWQNLMDFTEQIKDVNCHKYGPIMIIGLSQFSIKKILFFLYISVFLLTAEPLHRSDDFPVWAIHGYSIPSLGHLSSKAQLLGIKIWKDVQHDLIREQFNASRFTTGFSQTFFILIRRRCWQNAHTICHLLKLHINNTIATNVSMPGITECNLWI